ncbi:MAG: KH domain-containing protein, partial [Pseudomonadota bacterium]
QEIPHHCTIEVEQWQYKKYTKEKKISIHQAIIVARDSYRQILIGKNGHMIKRIGTQARHSIAKELGLPIDLFLRVKVATNWQSRREYYHQLGLSFKV